MIRRRKHKGANSTAQANHQRMVSPAPSSVINGQRESSRLSPEVLANPVNKAADWSQDSYTLDMLTVTHPLPQIVRCSSRLVPGEEQGLPVNVHVPMLLFEGRNARKLLAKHVGRDPRTNKLVETDDTIVIPGDYDGHFLRLQARTTQDKSAARSLKHVTTSSTPAFTNFTQIISFGADHVPNGGSNNASTVNNSDGLGSDGRTGSNVSSRDNRKPKELQQSRRMIHAPGSVFVVEGTASGKAKNGRRTRDVLLLRCSNEKGDQMIVPSDQPGEVVEVETPPPEATKLSMLPRDLMADNRYPSLVRFVYGRNPPRLTPCSDMFTLIDSFEESSLIGCLLYPNHALMIELPVNTTLGFQVALNSDDLMHMAVPRHALGVVQVRRETFMCDLKLKCKFLHRTSNSLLTHHSNHTAHEQEDDMPSATVRTRQYANEAFFYL